MVLLDAQLIRDSLARHNHDAQGVKVGFFSGSAQVENSDETVVMIEDRGCGTGHIVSLFKEVFAANDLDRLTMTQGKSKIDQTNHDLIHIDIFHDYANTYEAGRWAVDHSNVVLFHDTESFPL